MNSPVYLAGPMTGYPAYNFPAFKHAASWLRQQGYEVVSPAEMDEADTVPPGDRSWDEYLRRDLARLVACQSVAVLDGWRDSKGAALEVYVARALGMPVVEAYSLEPVTETILEEAQRVVHGARNKDYGHPRDNHGCTAAMVAAYLHRRHGQTIPFDAHDVCVFNALQKVSRLANTPGHHDSLVDIAGYAANIAMLAEPPDPGV